MQDNGKEYFGEEFVSAFTSILNESEKENKFMFLHGTAKVKNAEEICSQGLQTDYP